MIKNGHGSDFKTLAINVYEVEMLAKTFSDLNPVTSTFKRKNGSFRWRLNEMLLQKEMVVEDCKKNLKEFFENNLNKSTGERMAWDAVKIL